MGELRGKSVSNQASIAQPKIPTSMSSCTKEKPSPPAFQKTASSKAPPGSSTRPRNPPELFYVPNTLLN